MTSADDAPIRIVPYDPTWPHSFETERTALADLLAPWLAGPIEHVGSTAVPGLAAKPVIDIMVAVRELEASRPAIAELSRLGYCYFPYRAEVMHRFCKPSPALRTHHLQLVPWKSTKESTTRHPVRSRWTCSRALDAGPRRVRS